MKQRINKIIVVEGSHDAGYISSFYDTDFVITNGYEINKDDLEFLLSLNKEEILLLTDSDDAGVLISQRLLKLLGNVTNIKLDISRCNKNGKHGVAEAEKSELEILKKHVTNDDIKDTISYDDLFRLGLTGKDNSNDLQNYICEKFKLGKCNAKTMLKRLNFKQIPYILLEKEASNYGNK